MQTKKTVAIGFLGSTLDRVGKGAARWQKWRSAGSGFGELLCASGGGQNGKSKKTECQKAHFVLR